MSPFSAHQLRDCIERHLPSGASGAVLVAFSGGLDSSVLLRALTAAGECSGLRTIHIDHGLHPDSGRWRDDCVRIARTYGVPCVTRTVTIGASPEDGVEAAARRLRYEAIRESLLPGETLLTAHHADDQLETVLLALARGGGVDGLAAMPRCRRFGAGWHLRPLLDWTRDELVRWATEQGLTWREDPSNANTRFDRNYLRAEVIPHLRARWPSVAQSAVRSAAHLGEAASILDDSAARDLATATLGPCLKVAVLRGLNPARRRNLLRYWLDTHGARAPSTRKLAALDHDMLLAQEDRVPCVDWGTVEVRRHRGLLYCLPRFPEEGSAEVEWTWQAPLRLGTGLGSLRAEIAHGLGLARDKLPERLRLAHRVGGEWLRLPGHAHRRPLKKLLQEAGVLPWWRERLPLLFVGDVLVAVADLWVNADFAAVDREPGVRIVWDERPPIDAIGTDQRTRH